MSRRLERTVMNCRWWATAPLLLLLLLLAAVKWVMGSMSDGAEKLALALAAWRDGE